MTQLTNSQEAQMKEVTYLNEEYGTWGFYGCDSDIYETQREAYEAYLQTNKED